MTARFVDLLEYRTLPRRLGRFLAVGVAGTLVDVGLFALLQGGFGLPALLANTLSYSAGIVNNYVWHRNWTYADRPRKPVRVQAAQFVLIRASALLLNDAVVVLLAPVFTPWLGSLAGALLAKAGATAIGLAWNFLADQFWAFRAQPKETLS
jgi:putative flippase GtrA